jgi:predicted nucleotidyltransferase
MLDRTQTIEKLKATRQYFNEYYSVHSMTLLGSLARNEQRKDSDVDICVEMVPNLFNQAGVKMANHYFEVDADAIFSIIKNDLDPLKKAIGYFKEELFGNNNH